MPLFKGKSKKTFSKNVETEMDAGKPQKQALAIAYSMKKRSKKARGGYASDSPSYGGEMAAEGGEMGESDKWGSEKVRNTKMMAEGGDPQDPIPDSRLQSHAYECAMCGHQGSNEEHESDRHDDAGEPMMAEGGVMSQRQIEAQYDKSPNSMSRGVHPNSYTQKGTSPAGEAVRRAPYNDKEGNLKYAKDQHVLALRELRTMKDPKLYAQGGDTGPITEQNTDNYNSPSTRMHQTHDGDVDPQDTMTQKHQGNDVKPNDSAMSEDERKLNQHGMYEEGRQGNEGFYAEGGQITDNYADTEDGDGLDMVGKIMAQKQMEYSKGGQVANDTDRAKDMTDPRDDAGSGRYDDLVNRADDMEDADYTGANSGDELSDDREDHDRKDMVSKIMASRKKKDRLPNPR